MAADLSYLIFSSFSGGHWHCLLSWKCDLAHLLYYPSATIKPGGWKVHLTLFLSRVPFYGISGRYDAMLLYLPAPPIYYDVSFLTRKNGTVIILGSKHFHFIRF